MNRTALLLALAAPFAFAACDSAGHDHDEGEVITKVEYILTPNAGGTTEKATFNDVNRNGVVDAGEVTGVVLLPGNTYRGEMIVYGPSGNITNELLAESAEHLFVFTVGGAAATRVTIALTDRDDNALPFGRTSAVAVTPGGPAGGTLRLELVHFGSANAKRTAGGRPTTEMERDFDVTVPFTVSTIQ